MFQLFKKRNDIKLDAQQAVLDAATEELKEVTTRIGEVKDKLVVKANGALVGKLYAKQPK